MNRKLLTALIAAIAACAFAAPSAPAASLPSSSTALLSGQPSLFEPFAAPVGDSDIEANAVSANGRYVAFTSTSDGLVAGDDDRFTGVYRKDMDTGEVVLVSRRDGANGEPSHSYCSNPAISDDGLRVAFECEGSLDPADTNTYGDLYVRTVATGTTTLVSRVGANGPAGNNRSSDPALSQNGDYVAFMSYATDLVGGTNQSRWVYRRHIPTGETVIVSRRNGAAGEPIDGMEPSITDDGNEVAFSASLKGDDADTNYDWDIYVRNTSAGTTTLASRASGATGAVGNAGSFSPEISGNGLGVVFESYATNLDARDTASDLNVYRRGLGLGSMTVIDVNPAGVKSGESYNPSIDQSSHLIAFVSSATGLDPADTEPSSDVYVKNIAANTVRVVSRASGAGGAVANRQAVGASISGDGLKVASALDLGGITSDADPRRRTVMQYDVSTQTTRSVARPPGGDAFVNEGGDSRAASLSADGRFAAFTSDAPALGLPLGPRDGVFVRDRVTGAVTLASRTDGPGGAPFADVNSTPAISLDGRRVAFTAAEKAGGVRQVWVRDLAEGRTFLASRANGVNGVPADRASRRPKLDADGTRVVFSSEATNLGDGDTDAIDDIHVRDLASGETILASRANGGAGAKGDARSDSPDIDATGTRLTFISDARNLGDGGTDPYADAYLRDLQAETTRLVNTTPAGTKGNQSVNSAPSIDAAGNRVAFVSTATNLGDPSPDGKVFVRDFVADTLAVAERGYAAVISPDGGYLAVRDQENRVLRRDLSAGRTDLFSQRAGAGGVAAAVDADLGDISTGGACVSFATDESLVGPPQDSFESYLRVLTANCGDIPAAGGGADGGGPGATPLDKVAPVLSDTRLTRRRFRVARAATAVAAVVRRGTVLAFRSSEAATLRIAIHRVRRTQPRLRAAGTLTRRIAAGTGRVRFTGRIGRRALRAGSYRLRLTAVDAAGNRSVARVLRCRVVR
jgi:Tol biopolymer transport system component